MDAQCYWYVHIGRCGRERTAKSDRHGWCAWKWGGGDLVLYVYGRANGGHRGGTAGADPRRHHCWRWRHLHFDFLARSRAFFGSGGALAHPRGGRGRWPRMHERADSHLHVCQRNQRGDGHRWRTVRGVWRCGNGRRRRRRVFASGWAEWLSRRVGQCAGSRRELWWWRLSGKRRQQSVCLHGRDLLCKWSSGWTGVEQRRWIWRRWHDVEWRRRRRRV